MEALFFLLSVACIVYFVVIVLYSGITTAFCGVWIFLAAVFAMMGYFCIHRGKNEGGLPKRLPVFVFTSFGLFAAIFAFTMNMVVKEAKKIPEQGLQYVIVLGAKVNPDGLSKSLKNRLDRAYAYYLENPRTKLILSGGQGSDEVVPEALAMYNYLHLRGVPEENMRIEMFSTSTAENIRFSKAEIEADLLRRLPGSPKPRKEEEALPRVGIITSDFHVMRAAGIARKQGFAEVSGISAPTDSLLFVHMCVRECAAIIKDYIVGNL